MIVATNYSDSFTADDIRKLRDDKARRFTDEDGKIDWDGLFAETENGADVVRSEIARIRVERKKNNG